MISYPGSNNGKCSVGLEKAAAVLEDVNGFQLKGKPIIIQFGNKKS